MPRNFFSKPIKIFFLVLAITASLIFLNSKNLLAAPRRALNFIFSPVAFSFQKTGAAIEGSLNFILTVKDINKENAELKKRNGSLLKQAIELKELARENELLRTRLNIKPSAGNAAIFANIIGFDPLNGQYFIINKGSDDGLKIGQAIADANNFLIGKILSVQPSSAQAVFLTDQNCSISALSQDSRVGGIVKGESGLSVIMDMVPLDKQLKNDEPIITSGFDDSIPKGLLIGWAAEIKIKENEVFQNIKIRPAADLKRLENVFVIK